MGHALGGALNAGIEECELTMSGLPKTVRRQRNRLLLVGLGALLLVYLTSSHQISDLERVRERGSLVMLTIESPTTYFHDGRGENGFDFLLAKAFADSLGVELEVVPKTTLRGLFLSIGGARGDFGAANLAQTESRQRSLAFSIPYYQMTQQLIYRNGTQRPRDLNQLYGTLAVVSDSAHSELLQNLQRSNPKLTWSETDQATMGDLIRQVHHGEVDYAVVDSLAYTISRHIYQKAALGMIISDPQPIAWAFANHGDGSLLTAANQFLEHFISSGQLNQLKLRLFSQSSHFSVANSKLLELMVKRRLPAYRQMFERAAAATEFDWQLLAAVGYQESHWNPLAKSPTGVRGLMMLTRATAREMRVDNRLDPQQSITGGSRYLAKLKSRLPDRIVEPDRTWLTLAAYNVGYGHMEDARILAQRSQQNPDSWADVREQLPKLADKSVYRTLKYGYARGDEAVRYVDNIRYYQSYLNLHSLSTLRRAPADRKNSWLRKRQVPAPASL